MQPFFITFVFMTIAEAYRRVEALKLREKLPELVAGTSYEITALNQFALYNYGVDSLDRKLAKYKSKYYARQKFYQNNRPGFGIPDLRLTGRHYAGMSVLISGYTYKVVSNVPYSEKLVQQYGPAIYGLSKDNKRIYRTNTLMPAVRKYISQITGFVFR